LPEELRRGKRVAGQDQLAKKKVVEQASARKGTAGGKSAAEAKRPSRTTRINTLHRSGIAHHERVPTGCAGYNAQVSVEPEMLLIVGRRDGSG